jgi:hypothetical protein
MTQSARGTPEARRRRDGRNVVAAWEPGGSYGLTHFLALSSDLAEDRAILRACGVGARHWVRKPRLTNGPEPR